MRIGRRRAVVGAAGIVLVAAVVAGSAILTAPGVRNSPAASPGSSITASFAAPTGPSPSPRATASPPLQPTPSPSPELTANVDIAGLIEAPGSIKGFWAVAQNRLLTSVDGGASWKAARLPPLGEREWAQAVVAVDEDHIWAGYGGADENNYCLPMKFYRTHDGGTTWAPLSLPPRLASCNVELLFVDTTHGFAFGDGGVVYRTSDAGDMWTPDASTEFLSVVASDRSTLWNYNPGGGAMCALCGKPLLRVSRDAGRTWSLVSIPGFVKKSDYYSAGIVGMYFPTPSLGFLALSGKGATRIFGTSNAGRTWAQLATGPDGIGFSWLFSGVNESFWYFFEGENDRELLVTEDAGKAWRTETVNGWRLGFADRLHAFRLGETGDDPSAMTMTLFVSADGGRTWTPAMLPAA